MQSANKACMVISQGVKMTFVKVYSYNYSFTSEKVHSLISGAPYTNVTLPKVKKLSI